MSQAGIFTENPSFDSDVSVAVTGGYDCGYSTNSSSSVIMGTFKISNGTVTVENLIIQ